MSASDCYSLSNQKLLHEIDILDKNIHVLKYRTLSSPCITVTGFNKLKICPLMKWSSVETPINDVIQKMFMLLNIPHFWILTIEDPYSNANPYRLPSTVNIYLIADNIKMYVYNKLSKYLRHTDQKSVSVKLHLI